MKVALITFGTENLDHLNDLSFPNKEAYCKYRGYDFYGSKENLAAPRHPQWNKFNLCLKYISDYDWIFWSDTDAVITDFEKKLEDFIIPGKEAFFCQGGRFSPGLNSGHFLLKNTQWVKDKLLEAQDPEVERMLRAEKSPFMDQGAFRKVFHGSKYYHLYPQVAFNTKLRKHKPGHFIAHAWGGNMTPKLWKKFRALAVKEIVRLNGRI